VIFTRHGVDIDQYPAIKSYLSVFRRRLTPKPPGWQGDAWGGRKPGAYEWYEIQDTVDYYAEFEKPKIVAPAIVSRAQFAFDDSGIYSNDKTSIISHSDPFYLLGILNSALSDFFLKLIASTKQGGYFEQKPIYLAQLPIRRIDFSDPADKARHDRLVALVDDMLDLHRRHAAAAQAMDDARRDLARRIAAVDTAIDRLVYELYGLAEDEIAIVEISTT
jgi:hypothetical protein